MTTTTTTTDGPRLGVHERIAASIVAASAAGFGAYGYITAAPSTTAYVLTVGAIGIGLALLRRTSLPGPLAVGLAFLAIAHLAGGLVRVGDEVLYNTHVVNPALQYDHPVHASGVFLGTLAIWWLFLRELPLRRGPLVLVAILGGLGLGAVNETIEFAMTMLHDGSHVGGYQNTGWDLVSNVAGSLAAGAVIAANTRSQHGRREDARHDARPPLDPVR
jgi:hypothetical protein